MVKSAVVTGASSGIGKAIAMKLHKDGWRVYGIGRNFEEEVPFVKVECDLLDTNHLSEVVRNIQKEGRISVLVNNAGVGYYGLHEELNTRKIQEMVRTNLEIPMVLTQLLLRNIKEMNGYIINIESVTAFESNPHGCAYGATKAGLLSFSRSLFDEARKYGVKVVSILPDMTQTNLYRNADFCEDEDINAFLEPDEVAEAVMYALHQRDGMVISEIVLKPQLHRIKKKP